MSDEEFKELMSMQKHIYDDKISLPTAGELGKQICATSDSTSDVFILDLDRRGTISLNKKKIQERHGNSQTKMIRLEVDAPPHTNPDGTLLSRNHIHIYSEQYGMSMAYELDTFHETLFKDTSNFLSIFYDFCSYCNINVENLQIQGVI